MESIRWDGLSLQNGRKSNMDRLLLKDRAVDGRRVCLAAVCDGVGSMEDGAFASSEAVRLLIDWLDRLESVQRIGLRLRDAVLDINRAILREARAKGLRTASTLSALLLSEGKYYAVHVGDSRIYRLCGGRLELLTHDQVVDGKLAGCLGRSERIEVVYNEGLCAEQVFLLCSDGLYKKMDMAYLQAQLSRLPRHSLKKALEQLARFVVERGERDNISLALLICES